MPKRHNRRNRTNRGGGWFGLTSDSYNTGSTGTGTGTGMWDSISSLWKPKTSQSYNTTSSYNATPSYPQTSYPSGTHGAMYNQRPYGGSRRGRGRGRRTRKLRGGFKDYTPQTGLAAHAASFSGQTAQPHTWVGGRRKGRKTRRH